VPFILKGNDVGSGHLNRERPFALWSFPIPRLWWLIGAHAVPSFPKDTMSIRLIGALLGGAAFMLVTGASAQNTVGYLFAPQVLSIDNEPPRGGGRGGAANSRTVKSSKSNTSDRMGGGGGANRGAAKSESAGPNTVVRRGSVIVRDF
jgi:hypothetical protein